MAYLESFGHHAQPGARPEDNWDISNAVPDPDFAPDATQAVPKPEVARHLR
jgi:hypothetical protein